MRRTTRPDAISHPDGRPTCYSCFRPETHCLCNDIAPFKAHCNILILQHPHERRKYYSTTKLVLKSLTNSRLMRGVVFEPDQIEKAIEGQNTYLLYPSADAVDCEATNLTPNTTVIVVDGTWSEAGKIVRRNPVLATLPKLTFHRELRSQYKIRKQPKDNYLSTLECIGHMLTLNAQHIGRGEDAETYQRLFESFNKMVNQQFNYFPRMNQSLKLLN